MSNTYEVTLRVPAYFYVTVYVSTDDPSQVYNLATQQLDTIDELLYPPPRIETWESEVINVEQL